MTATKSCQRPEAPTAADTFPAGILAHAQASREVIQDFVPLSESLEWRLGQEYLRQRGNKAFLSDAHPVPFVINNDGALSTAAAEVLFAALQAAEQESPLPAELFVMELGIGVGLFARYFLDAFRDLCDHHRTDYYDRLTYIAADRSERMLRDVARHGVLAHHPGRYRLRLVDALDPAPLARDLMFRGPSGKPLQAVFLNYLLDCLPAASLEIADDQARQVCVRTCVARNVRLADYTDLTAKQLAERAKKGGPEAERDLLEVYGLFASEYDYRPVDLASLPFGALAADGLQPGGVPRPVRAPLRHPHLRPRRPRPRPRDRRWRAARLKRTSGRPGGLRNCLLASAAGGRRKGGPGRQLRRQLPR